MDRVKSTKRGSEPTPEPILEEELSAFVESDQSDPTSTETDAPIVPILEFDQVSKSFPGGYSAIDTVNLTILPGEFVTLVGASAIRR